jgi:hypothetical protein
MYCLLLQACFSVIIKDYDGHQTILNIILLEVRKTIGTQRCKY